MNVLGDDDAVFYRSGKLPLVILAKMEHHIFRRRALLKREVQPLEREEIDPYRLKLPLLYRHILDVSKLVMPTGSVGKRKHTTGGATAYNLW